MSGAQTALLTEDDIHQQVRAFYKAVRSDEILAPIFALKIENTDAAWNKHTDHIADFWSSIFLKTRRFKGNPMLKHTLLPGLTPNHFAHWLSLFKQTAERTLKLEQSAAINQMAERIAKSLQMGLAFNLEKEGQTDHPFSDFGLKGRSKP